MDKIAEFYLFINDTKYDYQNYIFYNLFIIILFLNIIKYKYLLLLYM